MSLEFPEVSTYHWSCNDSSKRFNVENPATGQVITTIQAGDASTAKQAIEASQKAFEQWSILTAAERSQYLFRCASELEKHADEIANILTMENGKPFQDGRAADVNFLIGIFRFFASIVDKLPSQFYDRGPMYCAIVHEPLGVCAGILPFNWPPIHTGRKVAPCLAAGNTIILKPGEQAPLTVARIVEILQGVLPKDVVQIVPGLGTEVPQALVEHPLVKMVAFTGSTAGGAAVAATAARSITKTVLELGGKNAMVIFDDTDFDLAVRDALNGAFFNKGEACTATSRLLIQRGIYDKFVERLAAGVEQLKSGNGMNPDTHLGPQVSRAQQKRVLDYIGLGEKEGARIAAQSRLPSDSKYKNGFFAPATLFADVTPDMRIAQEEMFGPIVTATPFDSYEDAVKIVNASNYGLTCAIYTRDSQKANRISRAVQVGMVFINNYNRTSLGAPFGGTKHSGYGREHCIETLHEWTQVKAIHTVSGNGDVPTWRAVTDIFGVSGSETRKSE